jgi:hypothetical protein
VGARPADAYLLHQCLFSGKPSSVRAAGGPAPKSGSRAINT